MTFLIILISCSTPSVTPPSEIKPIEAPSQRVSVPDAIPLPPAEARLRCQTISGPMDVYFSENQIIWGDHSQTVEGDIQAITCADLDKDGSEEAYLGFGMGRGYPKAAKQIWKVTPTEATEFWTDDSSRNQITWLFQHEEYLYLTAFTEGTTVAGGPIIDGAWVPEYAVPLALCHVPFEDGVLIGRVYGDAPRSDGDLKKYTPAGMKDYPISGGVRAIALADVNDDQHEDILVSDGWNYQYGKHAKARVRAYLGPDHKDIRTLANFDEDYTVNAIYPVQFNQELALVVQASHHVYLLEPDIASWKAHTIGPIDESGLIHISQNNTAQTILISGNPSLQLELPQ